MELPNQQTNINKISYAPGLHILMTLKVTELDLLRDFLLFSYFTDKLLLKFNLEKVGESSFVFSDTGGFTAAVCLKESHICIHTWPEFEQLTIDIYLCNYMKDNSEKVRDISAMYIDFFKAGIINKTEVTR